MTDNNDDDLWSEADEDELACMGCLCDEEGESGFALECDRVLQLSGAPQKRYWKTYFVVSDFTQQHWCEQQLLYSLSPEVVSLRLLPGEEISLEESTAAKAQKGKGSDIHQARELEIQVPVVVKVETVEDSWAVKFLNLQSAVLAFHSGRRVAREVPVFGMPFGSDLFVFGIIDELTYDPVHHAIQISELKTRRSHRSPKKSQLDKDRYQVGLYAQLFNELVQGKITKEIVCSQLRLNMDRLLGKEIREHIQLLDKSKCEDSCTLRCLLDTVLSQIQSLTCIMEAKIEYVHQETKAQITVMEVELDAEDTQLEFFHHCKWWKGKRGTKGVDIEDCWKCEFCQFAPVCEWREVMASKLGKQVKKK